MPILHWRKYLPHLESPNSTYFVTFGIAGSVPEKLIESWRSGRLEIIQAAESHQSILGGRDVRTTLQSVLYNLGTLTKFKEQS